MNNLMDFLLQLLGTVGLFGLVYFLVLRKRTPSSKEVEHIVKDKILEKEQEQKEDEINDLEKRLKDIESKLKNMSSEEIEKFWDKKK